MKPDFKRLKEAKCELLEVNKKISVWALPQVKNVRKLVAQSNGGDWTWVHPDFVYNGNNHKKKKQKR